MFHNIDMVGTFGWPVGATVKVDVLRNNVLIGTSTGQTFDAEADGGALEVNHGPLGAPLPGDCWTGTTPDILPGDLIRVTGPGSVNEVIVDNIDLVGPATPGVATDGVEVVEVRGVAQTAAGVPIPPGDLDSGEFRTVLPGGQYRANPDATIADPSSTVPGAFVMQYRSPYTGFRNDGNATLEQRRDALLTTDGHMTGFGHAAPLPDEAMLVEGFEDATTPAPGCEGSPMARDAVTATNHERLNVAAMAVGGNLEISGVSFDATAVSVAVGGLAADNEAIADPDPVGGPQTWTASVPMSQVATLPDGNVTVSMSSTRGGTVLPGASMSLAKDVVAPGAPAISPNGGAIAGVTPVSLSGDDELRYTVGNGSQTAPTASSGLVFNAQFSVLPGQTVKAIAVDAAGNESSVATAAFTPGTRRLPW